MEFPPRTSVSPSSWRGSKTRLSFASRRDSRWASHGHSLIVSGNASSPGNVLIQNRKKSVLFFTLLYILRYFYNWIANVYLSECLRDYERQALRAIVGKSLKTTVDIMRKYINDSYVCSASASKVFSVWFWFYIVVFWI